MIPGRVFRCRGTAPRHRDPELTRSIYTVRYDLLRDMLLDARKRAGLSQAEVAARLKRPQSFVSKYEHGDRRLDVVELIDVAEALGVDPSAIVRKVAKSSR